MQDFGTFYDYFRTFYDQISNLQLLKYKQEPFTTTYICSIGTFYDYLKLSIFLFFFSLQIWINFVIPTHGKWSRHVAETSSDFPKVGRLPLLNGG